MKNAIQRPGYPTAYELETIRKEKAAELQRYKNMLQRLHEDPKLPLYLKGVIEDFWTTERRD